MDKSITIQVIMPAKKKKTKFQVTKRQNKAIAYASDIPWVNQTNQRAQPHKKGYSQIDGFFFKKRIHLHHLGRYPLTKTTKYLNPNQGPLCQPGKEVRSPAKWTPSF